MQPDIEIEKGGSSSQEDTQIFIDSISPTLKTIAGSSDISFVASKTGEGSFFDHKKGSINIEPFSNGTQVQTIWIACHEVGHFRDLLQNPDGYLNQFTYLEERSKEIASEARWELNKKGQYHSSFDDVVGKDEKGKSISRIEQIVQKELHTLYNVIEDIAVNRSIGSKVGMFASDGSKGDEVSGLYKKLLFPRIDLSDQPLHRQFAYALLLGHMTDQRYIYSSKVVSELNGYLDKYARDANFTIYDEVSAITSPARKGGQDVKVRLEEIQRKIEPIYKKLLLEEIVKLAEKEDKEEQEGKDNGQDGPLTDPWGSVLGDFSPGFSRKDIGKIKEYHNEREAELKEQKRRDNMTPEQKVDEAQGEYDKKVCEKYNIPKTLAQEYREIEKEILPYKEELAIAFREFMQSINLQMKLFYTENNRSGKFNIDSFIKKYGQFMDPEIQPFVSWESLDVYDKKEFISRIVLQPSEINMRLVLDTSSSMASDRIHTLKQMAVLFMEALGTFEDSINLKFRMKKPFRVNTEIHAFGSSSEILKNFSKRSDSQKELAERFKSIEGLDSDRGGTSDALPLREIHRSISPEEEKNLKLGNITEIVFLITDGGSSTAKESKELVEKLLKKNIQARGLQIGNPTEEEMKIFKSIWGSNGLEISSLNELAPNIITLFGNFIESMRTKVSFYEGTDDDSDVE